MFFYELFIFNTMNETGVGNCAHNIHNFYTQLNQYSKSKNNI